MAPFAEPLAAARAGLELRDAVADILSAEGIAAGVGLHSGAVIEGMLGGEHVRGYDVIGDTVNTAKRAKSPSKARRSHSWGAPSFFQRTQCGVVETQGPLRRAEAPASAAYHVRFTTRSAVKAAAASRAAWAP
ncbi:MAG: hypothetical protein HY329_08985 [Chloroflexi bacterium]|nr:hypothetical protein [Chloroflexota bacterium]